MKRAVIIVSLIIGQISDRIRKQNRALFYVLLEWLIEGELTTSDLRHSINDCLST